MKTKDLDLIDDMFKKLDLNYTVNKLKSGKTTLFLRDEDYPRGHSYFWVFEFDERGKLIKHGLAEG